MAARKFKTVGMWSILSLAIAGLAFVALWFVIPPVGHIDIRYDGLSSSGVYWMLENRSTQSIYMQGTGDKIWPNSPITTCGNAAYSNEASDPRSLADGSPSLIRIFPGGHFRMNVATTLPSTYKGGHCYVRVSLLGGTFVESHEFTPN